MDINIDRITGKASLSSSPLTYIVTVGYGFTLGKTIIVQDGEYQKINEDGQLLYLTPMGVETTEIRTVTKTEPKEVFMDGTDEEGSSISKPVITNEPVEWVDNKPVMLPIIVDKFITFADSPTEFTVEEILQAKYQTMSDNSSKDHIIADSFINEDDIDLADKDHSANTGVAIMQLLPNGQAKTKPIKLEVSATKFELLESIEDGVDVYINGTKFVDNMITLGSAVNSVIIKFMNTTDKPIEVKSYAIAY
jgi:hypothetical protein